MHVRLMHWGYPSPYSANVNFNVKVLDFVQLGGLAGSSRELFDRSHRALRWSHHGSGPSRGGPEEIIAVPLLLAIYTQLAQSSYLA